MVRLCPELRLGVLADEPLADGDLTRLHDPYLAAMLLAIACLLLRGRRVLVGPAAPLPLPWLAAAALQVEARIVHVAARCDVLQGLKRSLVDNGRPCVLLGCQARAQRRLAEGEVVVLDGLQSDSRPELKLQTQ